jgi:solute carrier family 25 uncoupling protein 8/9
MLLMAADVLGAGGGKYWGAWHCTRAVYAAAGLGGFWRGWAANYARIGPQTVVTLVVAEKLRQLAGLASL